MPINPALKDVWNVARVYYSTLGIGYGVYLYTIGAFLYTHLGEDENALRMVATALVFQHVGILLLEVPTGVIADHIGRKRAVVLAIGFFSLFFFTLSMIPLTHSFALSSVLACLAHVFFALYFSFQSGSYNAWVVDTIAQRGISEGPGPLLGKSLSFFFLGQMGGALIGLSLFLLEKISYAYIFAALVTTGSAVYCTVRMKETAHMEFYSGSLLIRESFVRMQTLLKNGIRVLLQTPVILYLSVIYAFFMYLNQVLNYLWPVSMKANFGVEKMSIYWFVTLYGALLAAFVGSRLLSKISRGSSNIRLWGSFARVVFLVASTVCLLGFVSFYFGVPLFFFMGVVMVGKFGYGFLQPAFNTLVNNYIPKIHASQRATILSLESLFCSLITAVLIIPASGPSGKQTTVGWIIPGGLLLIVLTIASFFMRRYQRKVGEC